MHIPPPDQLIIFVGSRRAGRMRHLDRLVQQSPHNYEPLKTLTTREEPKEGDSTWFVRMKQADILERHSIDDMLTYYAEGGNHYFVVQSQLNRAQGLGRCPLVGMAPQGLERLMSRQRISSVPFSALLLQPADPDQFRDTLVREHDLEPETAAEETERAVRLSTLPPEPLMRAPSIIPVPISGTAHDIPLIDQALRSILSP